MSYEASASNWLENLCNGDEDAINRVFARYFDRLTRLATRKMKGLNLAVRSGEDIALSALRSFCSAIKSRRFVVYDETNLWGCLFYVVTLKVYAERRRANAIKRGSDLARASSVQTDDDGNEQDILANVVGRDPSPDFAAEMASCADDFLLLFKKKQQQRRIVELKFQGFNNAEIARQLGVQERTVYSHLAKIRERMEFVLSADILLDELFSGASLDDASKRAGWTVELAGRILDKALKLWLETKQDGMQKPQKVPCFLSEFDSTKSVSDDSVGTLEAWKVIIKTKWLDSLLATVRTEPN